MPRRPSLLSGSLARRKLPLACEGTLEARACTLLPTENTGREEVLIEVRRQGGTAESRMPISPPRRAAIDEALIADCHALQADWRA